LGTCYLAFADGSIGREHVRLDDFAALTEPPRRHRFRLMAELTLREAVDLCDQIEYRLTDFFERDVALEIDPIIGGTENRPASRPALDNMRWPAVISATAMGSLQSPGETCSRNALDPKIPQRARSGLAKCRFRA
jgi:hypothetical protein